MCQLDTSGAEWWHRGWDMKSVNEEGGGGGGRGQGNDRVGSISLSGGGKLPIKRDAIRAGRERGPEDHPLSLALSNYQL